MRVVPTSGFMIATFIAGFVYLDRLATVNADQAEYERSFQRVDEQIRRVMSDPSQQNVATMLQMERRQTERFISADGGQPKFIERD